MKLNDGGGIKLNEGRAMELGDSPACVLCVCTSY